ncbi:MULTISPECIES: hypothetical protein [unclassified Mesorhizobium]|uniref:hypothetical protein n=1 Tax=unclassified Mesorhizobium TaxID=325217 RepID=UPI000FCC73DF|nr:MULTISPECIES: hypothetical protein [unclassified Mesorhizobium]RUY96431.1 hypothetical protein EN974_19550 [Mesorhizobium sp. M7A.F.Ca.CA.001.12.2.1]RUZ15103.1 hypothetical protein EN949_33095 [Mesorhizobium sp. M7A.F.Ca.US.007.01.2.1]RUZ40546.1 hypothetical protein EN948_30110 [Mesorhizobium sp. M7A.F.Ca.US.003.02.1.1]RUZ44879.1 hypothetical protein EN950_37805 [Mesorhizobium sp. M7A.F.Ca.US.007.01.1.1]
MPKKPKDVMLPGVSGVTIDIDDRDNPRVCLVGLLTDEGKRSFTLNESGARMMVKAMHSFLDLLDGSTSVTKPKRPAN